MLYELEANWVVLEKQFLRYVINNFPKLVEETEEWIRTIRPLPIAEKTLLLAELADPLLSELTTYSDWQEWQNVKQSLIKNNRIKDVTIFEVFEKSIDQWIYVSRKREG
jgi:hypothetical protein